MSPAFSDPPNAMAPLLAWRPGCGTVGLRGVELVITDAHEGLKAAIEQTLAGPAWQRCRVHFRLAQHCVRRSAGVRNVVAYVAFLQEH